MLKSVRLAWLSIVLAAVGIGLLASQPATASHPGPVDWRIRDYYYGQDGNITVRICENMGKPASVAEAALSDWMAKFNNRVSWTRRTDCGAASDLLYWGRDNAYVDDYCDYVGAYACYDPYPTEWFAPRSRNVAKDNALIVVAYSRMAGRTDAQAKHIFAHEFGHGMGLAEHSLTDCSTVMGGQGCTTLPTWADTMTAAFNYVQ